MLNKGKSKNLNQKAIMANYATNIFYASTENEKDLDKIAKFLEDTFCDCYLDRSDDYIGGEFSSKWDYPEKEINEMISLLESKDKIYNPSADTRAVQRVCELSGILKRRMVL